MTEAIFSALPRISSTASAPDVLSSPPISTIRGCSRTSERRPYKLSRRQGPRWNPPTCSAHHCGLHATRRALGTRRSNHELRILEHRTELILNIACAPPDGPVKDIGHRPDDAAEMTPRGAEVGMHPNIDSCDRIESRREERTLDAGSDLAWNTAQCQLSVPLHGFPSGTPGTQREPLRYAKNIAQRHADVLRASRYDFRRGKISHWGGQWVHIHRRR